MKQLHIFTAFLVIIIIGVFIKSTTNTEHFFEKIAIMVAKEAEAQAQAAQAEAAANAASLLASRQATYNTDYAAVVAKSAANKNPYLEGTIESIHYAYTDNPNAYDCMKNWSYYNSKNKLITPTIQNITKLGDTKNWCAIKKPQITLEGTFRSL